MKLSKTGVVPNKSMCPSLTLKQRITGWAVCIGIGFLLSFFSSGLLISLASGNVVKFSIFYSIGTLLSLISSLFLWGPVSQCKKMFEKTRIFSTIIVLLCIVGIIACCVLKQFVFPDKKYLGFIILVLVIVQFCAYFWYTLSFIPFGRKVFCKCFQKAT